VPTPPRTPRVSGVPRAYAKALNPTPRGRRSPSTPDSDGEEKGPRETTIFQKQVNDMVRSMYPVGGAERPAAAEAAAAVAPGRSAGSGGRRSGGRREAGPAAIDNASLEV
jgi:hypothetical protein